MNSKIFLFALLPITACQQDTPQKIAEKNVATFVKSKMSKTAVYTPIYFPPLDSGDAAILEVAPHFLSHKFQSLTPSGGVVVEEWLFFMDSSLNIIGCADHSKGSLKSRSDLGEHYDKIGAAADSVVNNIIQETIK